MAPQLFRQPHKHDHGHSAPVASLDQALIGVFYQRHPAAQADHLRSWLSMGLLAFWAVRLTHAYFRR